jgi:tRNA dimethylallyltransferase
MSSAYHGRPLVAIVGPTAVGKTALALRLAQDLPVEVVSADSRQVYRYLDIGTAKPTAQERQQVRHHLIDVVDPDETFTLVQYQELAYSAINDVLRRERIPLLVGGTGLYVAAVLEGLNIPHVPPDLELREQLEAEADAQGYAVLHKRLQELDPRAAERIDARNVRRVIRALEVCISTGEPISGLQVKSPPPYRILRLGLTMPRKRLYVRIDQRIDHMMSAGLLEEVQSLVKRGYGLDLPSMSGLGYRQIGMYLRGEVSLDEAVALIKRHTRRFVRRQANWFQTDDTQITWFDVSGLVYKAILASVQRFVSATC